MPIATFAVSSHLRPPRRHCQGHHMITVCARKRLRIKTRQEGDGQQVLVHRFKEQGCWRGQSGGRCRPRWPRCMCTIGRYRRRGSRVYVASVTDRSADGFETRTMRDIGTTAGIQKRYDSRSCIVSRDQCYVALAHLFHTSTGQRFFISLQLAPVT